MSKRVWGIAAFALLAGILALTGALLLFTRFLAYDDEGYVLLTLVNFAKGHALYREVFTQYGPFFYWWHDAWRAIAGFEFNHTTGRLITLIYWLGAAVCCAGSVATSRAWGWSLLALAGSFAHLWQMSSEPMHPGGLIAFVIAFAAWIGAIAIKRQEGSTLGWTVGLAGAALVLTKINVGIFFLAGAGTWIALNTDGLAVTPWRRRLLALGFVGLPAVLMHSLWDQSWVITFAIVTTCSAAGVFAATATLEPLRLKPVTWKTAASGFAVLSALIVALTMASGVSARELLEGVLLRPLQHPGVYFYPIRWREGASILAVLSLGTGLFLYFRGRMSPPGIVRTIATVRIGLVAMAVAGFLGIALNPLALATSYGLSCIWLLVVPLRRETESLREAQIRGWLGLILVTQSLHAFPVAGSQVGWGTFLWIPLLALSAREAIQVLGVRPRSAPHVTLAVGIAAFAIAGINASTGWNYWRSSEPLRLPGAEPLRLPALLGARLRIVALNSEIHAGHLFSWPGLFSFNLWTDRPTPTLANTTHWFSLLDDTQQEALINQLAADPDSVVVVGRDLLYFLRRADFPITGPLVRYLEKEYAPAFVSGRYAFWCRRERQIAPISIAQLFVSTDPQSPRYRLQVSILAEPGTHIAAVEWLDASSLSSPVLRQRLDAHNSTVEILPLSRHGSSAGATAATQFPVELRTLTRLNIDTDEPLENLPRGSGLLRLRDQTGTIVAEAVFAE